jgi:hypothetical protein
LRNRPWLVAKRLPKPTDVLRRNRKLTHYPFSEGIQLPPLLW